ncbi:MAG: GNAT family N-acetyltransferase [Clostridiaceae bacterium]|nr:GNAT family N-acetyltransferase [Clostridiaceae bacterium]
MSIICRKGVPEDLPVLLEIEKKSTPKLLYLDGVKDEFFDNQTGELIVAEEDGAPIGFARFSLQYDGSGWLEILRVDPAHQKKGCGAVIWNRFIELCDIYKVPYVRMYTGLSNYASRILGERNGLHVAYQTREGTLMLSNAPDIKSRGFKQELCQHCVKSAISPYAEGYHGYFCQNRTFYGLNDSLYKALAAEKMAFRKGDSCVVIGARFLKDQGLHLGLMGGDLDECVSFAVSKLKESGLPKLVCMIPSEREDLREALEKYGFVFPEGQIIMLERKF